MRYERLADIVDLAIRMQVRRTGVTLHDIESEFGVSRSTAERMRNAVEMAFGPLEILESGGSRHHWRLRSNALQRLVRVSAAELADLSTAADILDNRGFGERASALRELDARLRATLHTDSLADMEADIETLTQAEGLAMRPGPRQRPDDTLLATLREAIATCRVVELSYLAQGSGRRSRQRIEPYGLLYGNRAFLVGRSGRAAGMRLWRIANMSEAYVTADSFTRDPEFSLEAYARRSFGTFQEEPVDVVLRFAAAVKRDASEFLFHPGQSVEENTDGTLTVRFTAGGIDEMCWHLVTWGKSVTVEEPDRLRHRLAAMCSELGAHHGSPR